MKIYLIRHGDPDYERDALTETGRRQARALSRLPIIRNAETLYASPMGRAMETAALAAAERRGVIQTAAWLREMDDVTVPERRRPDLAVWNISPDHLADLDGAGLRRLLSGTRYDARMEELENGVELLLEKYGIAKKNGIWTASRSLDSRSVAMFGHLGTMLTLIAVLLGVPPCMIWRSLYLAPASVTEILLEELDENKINFRLLRAGATDHLTISGLKAGTTGLQYNVK